MTQKPDKTAAPTPEQAAPMAPKGAGLFSAPALARLSATEDLDRPARLAALPRAGVMLAAALTAVAGGVALLLR
ncbi:MULTISPECIES: hypothetical protein [unclassified Pannonibacter]|uniref:hypothetical protein n=1 Tax=unclassified Pannonibacter TaxID=2627228 RepID=UPI001649662D|nr:MULTISPECIES: hypothetical protein [unclassified Pannonibacter]MBA4207171.1 hypothetical protein [Polymorphum sp.]